MYAVLSKLQPPPPTTLAVREVLLYLGVLSVLIVAAYCLDGIIFRDRKNDDGGEP